MNSVLIRLLVGAAAVLVGSTQAAASISDEDLSCAIAQVGPQQSAEVYANFERSVRDPDFLRNPSIPLFGLVYECAQRLKLSREEEAKFFEYSFCSVTRVEARRRLSSIGIDLETFDASLDIGPGRSNPTSNDFNEEQWVFVESILTDLYPSGTIPSDTMLAIGFYTVGSQCAFRARSELQ